MYVAITGKARQDVKYHDGTTPAGPIYVYRSAHFGLQDVRGK